MLSPDFEVDRGRPVLGPGASPLAQAGLEPALASSCGGHNYRDGAVLARVERSFSRDPEEMVETLVLGVRDPKDLWELRIESRDPAVTMPPVMLAAGLPAGWVKLERSRKSSVGRARWPGTNRGPAADQRAYEPLFASASWIF